jgi:hypothetical protein
MAGRSVIAQRKGSPQRRMTMKNIKFNVMAIAITLALGSGAIAQTMSKDHYKSAKDGIATDYKFAKAECDSLSGNAKDICMARANGNEKIAMAELDAGNTPSANASFKVRIARADADYAVAREKCDDRAGNVKDVCVKQAKAAEVAAKADATVQMKTANANDKAADTSNKANNTANEKGADARKDAVSDKRDADYAVAKEKCDAFASTAKSNCLNEAKLRFGKV